MTRSAAYPMPPEVFGADGEEWHKAMVAEIRGIRALALTIDAIKANGDTAEAEGGPVTSPARAGRPLRRH